jgi:hypothetical protein
METVLLLIGQGLQSYNYVDSGSFLSYCNTWFFKFCGTGPHPLLWAAPRAARGQITRNVRARCPNYCVTFVTYAFGSYVLAAQGSRKHEGEWANRPGDQYNWHNTLTTFVNKEEIRWN